MARNAKNDKTSAERPLFTLSLEARARKPAPPQQGQPLSFASISLQRRLHSVMDLAAGLADKLRKDPNSDTGSAKPSQSSVEPQMRVHARNVTGAVAAASSRPDTDADEEDDDGLSDQPEARIVAYSDSDAEDAAPLLLGRMKVSHSAEANEGSAPESGSDAEDADTSGSRSFRPPQLQGGETARAGRRRMGRLWREGGSHVRGRQALDFLLKMLFLGLLGWLRPKALEVFEVLTLAVPLPAAIRKWLGVTWTPPQLPPSVYQAAEFVGSCATPALALQVVRYAHAHYPRRSRRPRPDLRERAKETLQEAQDSALADTAIPAPPPPDKPTRASDFAAHFAVELAAMRRLVAERGAGELPAPRFDETNAELMRFACTSSTGNAGLLFAQTMDEKAAAIENGVARLLGTLRWAQRRRFMSQEDLQRWEHLVRWEATDGYSHPVLVVQLAAAIQECTTRRLAEQFAEAIISQVHWAVNGGLLSNAPPRPEVMAVVVDAAEATSLGVTRCLPLLRRIAVTLNEHYPARLQSLYLVELPTILRWAANGVTLLLHPATRDKIQLCSRDSANVPLNLRALLDPPGAVAVAGAGDIALDDGDSTTLAAGMVDPQTGAAVPADLTGAPMAPPSAAPLLPSLAVDAWLTRPRPQPSRSLSQGALQALGPWAGRGAGGQAHVASAMVVITVLAAFLARMMQDVSSAAGLPLA